MCILDPFLQWFSARVTTSPGVLGISSISRTLSLNGMHFLTSSNCESLAKDEKECSKIKNITFKSKLNIQIEDPN